MTARRPISWLGAAWLVARKDVKYMLRQRETLLWVFLMPPVFFFFIGSITSGFSGSRDRPRLVLDAHESAGFIADHIERRLDRDFSVVQADSVEGDDHRRHLAIPAAFTDSVLAGIQTPVELTLASQSMTAEYDRIRVGRAIYSVLADLVVTRVAEDTEPTAAALDRLFETPRQLSLVVSAAGERRTPPSGFEQAIPGTLTMFTFVVLLTSGSVLLVIERREGLLRRLATSPLPRGAIVLGKWGGRLALGVLQIAFAMIAGRLLFGMHWGNQIPALWLVLIAYGGLAAALGMLLGNLARTESQAVATGVLASNLLAPLGGCWWPIEVTPRWMQKLALWTPTGWAMDAMHELVSFGAGASAILPHVAVLGISALFCGWLVARTFRFQ